MAHVSAPSFFFSFLHTSLGERGTQLAGEGVDGPGGRGGERQPTTPVGKGERGGQRAWEGGGGACGRGGQQAWEPCSLQSHSTMMHTCHCGAHPFHHQLTCMKVVSLSSNPCATAAKETSIAEGGSFPLSHRMMQSASKLAPTSLHPPPSQAHRPPLPPFPAAHCRCPLSLRLPMPPAASEKE